MMQLGGGAPGDLPITMAQRMPLGGHVPGELPITMCQRPSQGDARLTALAAKLPLGAPLRAPASQTVQACLPLETLLYLRLPLPLETVLYLRVPLQTLSQPMPLLEPSALGPLPLEGQKAKAGCRS